MNVRKEKLTFLRQKGIDPFGARFDRTHTTKDIKEQFDNLTKEELDKQKKS